MASCALVASFALVLWNPGTSQPEGPDGSWLEQVTASLRAAEYELAAAPDGVLSATNRAQGFRARITAAGVSLEPRAAAFVPEGGAWQLFLATRGFGRGEELVELAPAAPALDGGRATLARGPLVEWFRNDERGLEQGWTISAPFRGAEGELRIALAFEGGLSPRIQADGLGASLVDGRGAVRLRYEGLAAWDADGRALPARLASTPGGVEVRVDDAGARYPVTVDPVVLGPVWSAQPDQAGANLGEVAPAGDVNGDGYADILVGANGYDAGQADEGRAFLFLGGPGGPGTTPSWSAESNQAGARFGWRVSTAGDVNGDGYDDVIVGAYRMDLGQTDEGAVFGYLGSPSGLETTASWMVQGDQDDAHLGWGVSAAGDVNGDGYGDVIVSANLYDDGQVDEGEAYVYLGSASGLETTPAWTGQADQASAQYGYRVAAAGDVDGDGFDDVAVGAFHYTNGQTNEGRAFVYQGSPSGPSTTPEWMAEGNQANAEFGWSLACAGDVNGDGYADLVVSAARYDNGQVDEGRVAVYHGSASGLSTTPAWTAESNQAGAGFGSDVASAGDLNGDGCSDLVVGAALYDNPQVDEGRIYVYLGSPSGLRTSASFISESNQAGAQFGLSVAQLGDVDGDGRGDFIGGAPFFDQGQTDEGLIVLYLGLSDVLDFTADTTLEGNQADGLFGFAVSRAGDVNGDGYGDVVVGAVAYDDGEMDEGSAFLFLGSAAGLATTPSWSFESDQIEGRLGWIVADAGDVNGDGYDDVIVGAPDYDNGEQDEGRAYLFHGSAAGLSTTPDWMRESDQIGAHFGRWMAGAGDVNDDGFADVLVAAPEFDAGEMDEGRIFLFLGSAQGLSTTEAWTFESDQASARLGEAVDGAGDVNRDGRLDVISGAPLFTDDQMFEGRAWVHLGTASGLATTAAWMFDGDRDNAMLGTAVTGAGDVNGDGFSDVVVSEPGVDAEVHAFHGSSGGPSLVPDWTVLGTAPGDRLGESLSGAGDVNGDGFDDVVVGASFFSNGQSEEGGAFLFLGSSAGLADQNAWSAESNQSTAEFGWSVSSAGDVNGDGFADVVIGSFNFANGQQNEGHAFVYLGNDAAGGRLRVTQQLRVATDDPIGLYGASDSPDLFRVRVELAGSLAGVAWAHAGPDEVWLETEVKPFDVDFDGTGIQRGAVHVLDPLGGPLVLEELLGRPNFGTRLYRWRARLVTTNPLFPVSAWFSTGESGLTEPKLRFPPRAGSVKGIRKRRP